MFFLPFPAVGCKGALSKKENHFCVILSHFRQNCHILNKTKRTAAGCRDPFFAPCLVVNSHPEVSARSLLYVPQVPLYVNLARFRPVDLPPAVRLPC